MRHAAVCSCRDCGIATLTAIMEGMPDADGKMTVAVAAMQAGCESLRVEDVALPYVEVLTVAERMEARLLRLNGFLGELQDPHAGPAADLIEELEGDLRILRLSWRRP